MSASKQFPKIITDDVSLNRVQDNISTLTDYIQVSPLTGSVSIVDVRFTSSSPVKVAHKLGRVPTGFIVADIDAARTIHRNTAFTPLLVELHPSGACNAKIIFF